MSGLNDSKSMDKSVQTVQDEIYSRFLGIEREIYSLLAELSETRQDKARVDWMEENIDDLTAIRDANHRHVTLFFCSPATGCQVEVKCKTMRAAVDQAMAIGKGLKL